ncbi:hypothetical protein T484DRAFT_2898447 [Baffinella frigidus]|nr:hypothetical protein T484DRAFT_2898447 [Cryptophyta sp. CCMP2293]
MLSGASKASDFYTADTIFEMVAPILDACPPALVACQDRQDVTAAVVGLYVSIAESQVSWLSVEQMSIFDLACLKLLRTFAGIEEQDSVRGKASWRRTEREDWLGHHMLALLQLLLNLARHGDRTDSVDFSKEARGGHMDVADVVLYGLGLIQPLITPEALQVPALAKAFFNLLGWLMEAHPHKIAELEKSVADPLMACLLHGLQHMDADLSRVAVEAIDALASHHVTMVQVNGTCLMKTAHPSLLATFLRALLEMLLFREFNRGMLDACCDALLSLMLCEQACFTELMGGVVQGQVLDSLRHQVSPPPFLRKGVSLAYVGRN